MLRKEKNSSNYAIKSRATIKSYSICVVQSIVIIIIIGIIFLCSIMLDDGASYFRIERETHQTIKSWSWSFLTTSSSTFQCLLGFFLQIRCIRSKAIQLFSVYSLILWFGLMRMPKVQLSEIKNANDHKYTSQVHLIDEE